MSNIETLFIKSFLENETKNKQEDPPLQEVCILKSFLHLRPKYIIRCCDFYGDYELDPIWPEVLLMMDLESATKLKDKLEKAWKRVHSTLSKPLRARNDASPLEPLPAFAPFPLLMAPILGAMGVTAYNVLKSAPPECDAKSEPICVYRIEKYNDEAFYRLVHRVPISIRNLKKLEKIIGVPIVKNLIEV